MNQSKITLWVLIVIGTISLFSSIFLFVNDANVTDFLLSGISGLALIVVASDNLKKLKSN